MADPLVDLVSLAEAKAYLAAAGQTAPSDSDLALLITRVSATIQAYLSRNLVSQAYTEDFSGVGSDRVMFPNTPITAVASVSVDGVAVPASNGQLGAGYVFDEDTVYLRGYRFSRGALNCRVSYTAGFVTIPSDIKSATFEGLSAVMAVWQYDDPRAVELTAGGTKIKLADGGAKELSEVCLTPNITATLVQRRRVVPC